jgi:hypothetical protein
MTLKLIGAGFGRTGTNSLKAALEQLGLGPCHHMIEVLDNAGQIAYWRAAADCDLPDWDIVFEGFNSAVDWPSAFFWRELAAHYADAKRPSFPCCATIGTCRPAPSATPWSWLIG